MRIVIVDDDQLVSISLKTILEASGQVEVLGIGKNGNEAIALYEKYHPDLLLMDIRMETMTGLDSAKIILEKYKDARILFLTTFSDDEYIIQALNIGAKGYLLKQDFESIVPALKAVHSGQSVFGGEIISKIPELMYGNKKFEYNRYGLNEKEFQLVQAVAEGLSNKEVAKRLFLGEGTVRNYLSTVLEKLNLRDRTQLAVFYYKNL